MHNLILSGSLIDPATRPFRVCFRGPVILVRGSWRAPSFWTPCLFYETGGYVSKVYHCRDCNYVGALVVEAIGVDDQGDKRGRRAGEEWRRNEGGLKIWVKWFTHHNESGTVKIISGIIIHLRGQILHFRSFQSSSPHGAFHHS